MSDDNATLVVDTSIEGLALQESFMLLSSTGLAYRRCHLDGVNGGEICVSFLRGRTKKKKGQ